MRSIRLSLALLAPVLLAGALRAAGTDLEIHVLRVGDGGNGDGQGSAAFVRGPDGTRVLIDGGNPGDGNGVVVPYLASLAVTDLDYSIASHWDGDHVGGMDEVFNAGYLPPVAYDRGDFQRPSNSQVNGYLAAVGGSRATPSVGTTIALGDGATITIEAANGATSGGTVTLTGGETQFENASSLVAVVRYGSFECYFGGDLTAGGNGTPDVESLAANAIGQVEVVVASHHGSFTSSSTAVVAALDPSVVLYSCGLDNPYGHPDDRIVERWSTPAATRVQWSTTEGDTVGAFQAGGFTGLNDKVVIRTDGCRFTLAPANGDGELLFTTFENPGYDPTIGRVVVSELLVDPAASADTYGEWFELVNTGPNAVDLGGCRFVTGSDTFTLVSRLLLRQNEKLVVGVDGKRSRNGNAPVHVSPPFGDFALANAGGTLTVRNGSGVVLESVTWGPGGVAVRAGVSDERVDLLAGSGAANFANAPASWSGGDKGTPGEDNDGDATTGWEPGLWSPHPRIDDQAEFHLTAFADPGTLFFLGVSRGFFPGFLFQGFHVPLNPDGLFLTLLSNPAFLSTIDASGRALVTLNVPDKPSLIGQTLYSNFLTLGFGPTGFFAESQSNLGVLTIKP